MSLIRLPELRKLLGGIGKTTLHRWEAAGAFPQRRRVGERAVAWDLAEVNAWLAARPTVTVNCADAPRAPVSEARP